MSRNYKIDVQLETNGAVEELKRVSTAEDQVVDSSSKMGTALDQTSAKQRTAATDTRGLGEAQKTLATSGDQLGTAVKNLGSVFDQLSTKGKTASTDVRGLDADFGRISVSTTEADHVLSDLYVNLQKLPSTLSQVRGGLNEVATGAGVTVQGLGLLGTAGALMGAYYAGWKIGTMINDFLGLDKAIGKAAQTLREDFGGGSETLGAKQDVITRAIERGASATISYSDALKFNAQWLVDWKSRAQEMDDTAARLRGPEESAKQIQGWNVELEKVRAAGVLPALTADLQSHNFSHAELAQRYRISSEALGLLQRDLTATAQAFKGYDAFVAEVIKRQDEFNKKTDEYAAKAKAIEVGGDHAYGTLHTWLQQLGTDQKQINDLTDAWFKKLADGAAAEKAAKDAIVASYGGVTSTPQSQIDDQITKIRKDNPGQDTTYREQQATDAFLKSELAAAQAADAFYQSGTKAAGAADGLSTSHAGATRVADDLSAAHRGASLDAGGLGVASRGAASELGAATGAMASFRGVLVGAEHDLTNAAAVARNLPLVTNNVGVYNGDGVGMAGAGTSAGMAGPQFTAAGRAAGLGTLQSFDVGGPIPKDGPIMAHRDEYVVPVAGALVLKGGGSSSSSSTVINNYIDAKGATFEDDRALDRLADKMATRLGSRFQQRGG